MATRSSSSGLNHRQPPGHIYSVVHASDCSRLQLGDNNYYYNTNAPDLADSLSSSLFFPEIFARYENIEEHYSNTFGWIWERPSDGQPSWDSFSDWINGDSSLYWISGKPGSGKSTLMKYLLDEIKHTDIYQFQGTHHIVLSYWFWEASNVELQRDLRGCIRSLLWQLLQDQTVGDTIAPCIKNFHNLVWTNKGLLNAFRVAFEKLSRDDRSVIILLDGLDESGVNAKSLLAFIKDITTRFPRLKLCVSSRPEQIFRIHLSNFPHLKMQALNASDVDAIVKEELFESPEFAMLNNTDAHDIHQIGEMIRDKAQGVLLWVRLAIRELLRGLGNRDTIAELKIRLEKLPEELNDLYNDMLQRNNNDATLYREHAALYLQLVTYRELSLPEFWLAISDDIRQAYLNLDDGWEDLRFLFDVGKLETWINVRAAGLLEVRHKKYLPHAKYNLHGHLPKSCFHNPLLEVCFIHRTAKSYVTDTLTGVTLLKASSKSFEDIQDVCLKAEIVYRLILTVTENGVQVGYEVLPEFLLEPATRELSEIVEHILCGLSRRNLLWLDYHPPDWNGEASMPLLRAFPGSKPHGIYFSQFWATLGQFEFAERNLQVLDAGSDPDHLASVIPYAIFSQHLGHQDSIALIKLAIKAGANPNLQVQNTYGELISMFHESIYAFGLLKVLYNDRCVQEWLMQANNETLSRVAMPSIRFCCEPFFNHPQRKGCHLIGNFALKEIASGFPMKWTRELFSRRWALPVGSDPCIVLFRWERRSVELFAITREDAHFLLSRQRRGYVSTPADANTFTASGMCRNRVGIIGLNTRRRLTPAGERVRKFVGTRGRRLSSLSEALLILGKSQNSITSFIATEETRLKLQLKPMEFTKWRSFLRGAAQVIEENCDDAEVALHVWKKHDNNAEEVDSSTDDDDDYLTDEDEEEQQEKERIGVGSYKLDKYGSLVGEKSRQEDDHNDNDYDEPEKWQDAQPFL